MPRSITKVAVIGAGTMGAAIAAHVANAGIPVRLFDVAPSELTPDETAQGLTLAAPQVRNRFVQAGLQRVLRARPAAFMSREAERLISLGNTGDDFPKLAEADWIIEAIIERLSPKQALFERIEAVRKPGSIVSSNTSGLPIASLAQGRSDDFKHHFLGTHFFNPPRYMKLLEIIPLQETDPEVLQTVIAFAENRLGKGVVNCKDTPNFIGNRLFSISSCFAIQHALEQGYSVTEIDALTGPLLGRPKTATFRLLDLVGIDVAAYIAENLYDLIPQDPYRKVLRADQLSRLLQGLVKRGWLGNKSRQGFYKKDKTEQGDRLFKTLNLKTFEYEIPVPPAFGAVEAVKKMPDTGQRLKALFENNRYSARGAQYVWSLVSFELAYAAAVAPEIAHNLKSIDDDVRWGFNFELGPFQLWDELGVAETAAWMAADGLPVADWVRSMLTTGHQTFYRTENGRTTGFYDWLTQKYEDIPAPAIQLKIAELRHQHRILETNDSATLFETGDGVLLLEFHSKMNTIDEDMISLMARARLALDRDPDAIGLVIGNQGKNFCAGANLTMVGLAAEKGQPEQIELALNSLQAVLMAFKYSPKPVVVAVHNSALGGGAEIVLGSSRVVAHAESYIGLVEPGVGLVPAAGGVTAFVERVISPPMQEIDADPLPLAQKILETIGMARVSSSAAEARELGFLAPTDRIVMNQDQLLYEAKQEVLTMVYNGYTPPTPTLLYAGGRDLLAALKSGLWLMKEAGYISEHDALIGQKLAYIISGGPLSAPQWVNAQHFLDLERKAFLELVVTEKTQARVRHMLETGKPLRN